MHSLKRCSLTPLLRHHQDPIAFPFEEGRGQGVSTHKSGQLLPYCWLGYPLWRNETWRFPCPPARCACKLQAKYPYLLYSCPTGRGEPPPLGTSSAKVVDRFSKTPPSHLHLHTCIFPSAKAAYRSEPRTAAIAFTPTRLMMPCPPPRVPPPH